jgi:hypothetical protein
MELLRAPDEPVFEAWGPNNDIPHLKARMHLIKSRGVWWEELPELPVGMKIVEMLKELDFSIHILTQGTDPEKNTEAWSYKAKWAMKHLPGIPITITRNKGLVYGRVLVDDWPDYVLKWLKWRPRGQVIMPAQKWNKDFSHPNVFRYDGTKDIELKRILQIAKLG